MFTIHFQYTSGIWTVYCFFSILVYMHLFHPSLIIINGLFRPELHNYQRRFGELSFNRTVYRNYEEIEENPAMAP